MTLHIVEGQRGDVALLTLSGSLRMGLEAEALRETLRTLMTKNVSNVIMNLDELTYIDSYGLGELVACLTTVKKRGGTLKLTKPTEFVRDVLQTTRLDTLFDSYDCDEEAFASFSRPDRADGE